MNSRTTLVLTLAIILLTTGGLGYFFYHTHQAEETAASNTRFLSRRKSLQEEIIQMRKTIAENPPFNAQSFALDRAAQSDLARYEAQLQSAKIETDLDVIDNWKQEAKNRPRPTPTTQDQIDADLYSFKQQAEIGLQMAEEALSKDTLMQGFYTKRIKLAKRDLEFLRLARTEADVLQLRKWHAEDETK